MFWKHGGMAVPHRVEEIDYELRDEVIRDLCTRLAKSAAALRDAFSPKLR